MIEKKNTKLCCSLCVSATRKGSSSVISFKRKYAVFLNTLPDQTTKALASLFCSPDIFMIFHKKWPGQMLITTLRGWEYIMSPDTMKVK